MLCPREATPRLPPFNPSLDARPLHGWRIQAISPRAAALRSLTQLVPPTELIHGACLRYGNSSSDTAPRMKSATSARLMDPAWFRRANTDAGRGSFDGLFVAPVAI